MFAASIALAASAHFVQSSASLTSNGTLVVSFKEAGLGDNENVTITASATGTAVYACFTRSGNVPQASNKVGPTTVSASGVFPSGKNGQVTGSLPLSPPPSGLSCPGGQEKRLASVYYEKVMVSDTTNGVSSSIDGTFGATYYDLGPGNNAH
jgi:hypothetical protein